MSDCELKPGDVWGDPSEPCYWQYRNIQGKYEMFGSSIISNVPNTPQRKGINITAALAKAQADAAALERVRALIPLWKHQIETDPMVARWDYDWPIEELRQAIEGGA